MSDHSLILGNGQQLTLLDDDAELPPAAYAEREAAGKFTGERLFSENPKLYHAIASLLARGHPYREIAEICQVSTNSVHGVCWREGTPVETLRERIGRLALDVASLSIEAMRDLLADPDARERMTLKDLAIAHDAAVRNSQLLLGGATARMEVDLTARPTRDDYLRELARLTAEAATRPPRNVTGSPGESAGDMGAQGVIDVRDIENGSQQGNEGKSIEKKLTVSPGGNGK
jgi:hypothetical protein